MATGTALLINVSAGKKIGLIRGYRRLFPGALPDRGCNGFVRQVLFHRQRAAFRSHIKPAPRDEEIFGRHQHGDSED